MVEFTSPHRAGAEGALSQAAHADLSVVITTYNERINIDRAIRSARLLSDDILIIDSGSTDGTLDVVRELGARLLTRPFDDMARQRNAALEQGQLQGRYAFFMDADEMVTKRFAAALRSLLESDPSIDGVSICRRFHFWGKWVPAASSFPRFVDRVVLCGAVTFRKESHGEVLVGARRIVQLDEPLHDEDLKGIRAWIDRHNHYAEMEARGDLELLSQAPGASERTSRFRRIRARCRRLPGWPLVALFYYLVVRRGLLEGPTGWTYCVMKSMFEYFVQLHTRQLRR